MEEGVQFNHTPKLRFGQMVRIDPWEVHSAVSLHDWLDAPKFRPA